MVAPWPAGLIPASVSFDLANASRTGGVSTIGLEQIVSSASSRWTATLSGVPIRRNAEVLAWRAFKAGLRGRTGTVLVPVFDGRRAPWPIDAYGRVLHPGALRRRALDGTPYADPALPAASAIIVRFAASAARRSTVVSFVVYQGQPIRPGMYFSAKAGRLHVVTADLGGGSFSIEPPLRDVAIEGQAADFAAPTSEMRLASDDSGQLELELARFGSVSLDFVEVF